MKLILICLLISISISQSKKYADFKGHQECSKCDDLTFGWDDRELNDGELILSEGGDEIIRIERDGSLFIDGKQIKTSKTDKRKLQKYVDYQADIISISIEIGKEGASMGLHAVKDVFGALLTFDSEKMGKRLEKMERKLEKKEHDIEEAAEELEEIAEEFADLRCELKQRFKKLRYYDEF